MDDLPMEDCQAWVGRTERRADQLTPALAARWLATFDLPVPATGAMPQGIHLALCTPDAPTSALGADGHPVRDPGPTGFLPPVPLPRRMWAASEIAFLAPIGVGAAVTRVSHIDSVTAKSGRSGDMVFVDVVHDTAADGVAAVRERQTLVYRDAAAPASPLQPPPPGDGAFAANAWPVHRTIVPSEALLFRFSALTFNSHRIHYDTPYARDAERYRGLVVHGPLMASLLLQLAGDTLGDQALARFAFRALSPAIAGEPLHLTLREADGAVAFGAFAADGRQVVEATGAR